MIEEETGLGDIVTNRGGRTCHAAIVSREVGVPAIIARLFDERDPAVRTLVAQAIADARRLGRKIGLCGQAPSDYPEFARFLIECGIDSMSLNPDAVLATTRLALEAEAQVRAGARDAVAMT